MTEPTIPPGLEEKTAKVIAYLRQQPPNTFITRAVFRGQGIPDHQVTPVGKYLAYHEHVRVSDDGNCWLTPRAATNTTAVFARHTSNNGDDPQTRYATLKAAILAAPVGKGYVAAFFSQPGDLKIAARFVNEKILVAVRPGEAWRRWTEQDTLAELEALEPIIDDDTDEEPPQTTDALKNQEGQPLQMQPVAETRTEDHEKEESKNMAPAQVDTDGDRLQRDIPKDYEGALGALRAIVLRQPVGAGLGLVWFENRSPTHGQSIAETLTTEGLLAFDSANNQWMAVSPHHTNASLAGTSSNGRSSTCRMPDCKDQEIELGLCDHHFEAFRTKRQEAGTRGRPGKAQVDVFVASKGKSIHASPNVVSSKPPRANKLHKRNEKQGAGGDQANSSVTIAPLLRKLRDLEGDIQAMVGALPEREELRELREEVLTLRAQNKSLVRQLAQEQKERARLLKKTTTLVKLITQSG